MYSTSTFCNLKVKHLSQSWIVNKEEIFSKKYFFENILRLENDLKIT